MAGLGLGLFKGSSMGSEESDEPAGMDDEGPEAMAAKGVMEAIKADDAVAFADAMSTLLDALGYTKSTDMAE